MPNHTVLMLTLQVQVACIGQLMISTNVGLSLVQNSLAERRAREAGRGCISTHFYGAPEIQTGTMHLRFYCQGLEY